MSDFTKLLQIADSETIRESSELPKVQLHKWLVLGQTEYVCRFGTLSDGHEKITDSQRYGQAIKEMYYLALNIKGQKAVAKRAQAKLIRAEAKLANALSEADRLDAEADKEEAESQLASALVTVEDQMRMVKTYEQVRRELGPIVEAQYPEGIEQAELDNWTAVYKYRMEAEKTPGMARQLTFNIPLPPEEKAKLGIQYGRMDSVAPLLISDEKRAISLIEHKKEEK
jgi:hypothetical protein